LWEAWLKKIEVCHFFVLVPVQFWASWILKKLCRPGTHDSSCLIRLSFRPKPNVEPEAFAWTGKNGLEGAIIRIPNSWDYLDRLVWPTRYYVGNPGFYHWNPGELVLVNLAGAKWEPALLVNESTCMGKPLGLEF
jgi:hypothetical protein